MGDLQSKLDAPGDSTARSTAGSTKERSLNQIAERPRSIAKGRGLYLGPSEREIGFQESDTQQGWRKSAKRYEEGDTWMNGQLPMHRGMESATRARAPLDNAESESDSNDMLDFASGMDSIKDQIELQAKVYMEYNQGFLREMQKEIDRPNRAAAGGSIDKPLSGGPLSFLSASSLAATLEEPPSGSTRGSQVGSTSGQSKVAATLVEPDSYDPEEDLSYSEVDEMATSYGQASTPAGGQLLGSSWLFRPAHAMVGKQCPKIPDSWKLSGAKNKAADKESSNSTYRNSECMNWKLPMVR